MLRALAAAGIVCVVGYALTPQTAGGPYIYVFQANVRFLYPALILGLVLLPSAAAVRTSRRQAAVTAALAAMVVATEASYAHELRPRLALFAFVAAACGVGGVVLAAGRGVLPFSVRSFVLPTMISLLLCVGAGWAVQDRYFRGRYRDFGLISDRVSSRGHVALPPPGRPNIQDAVRDNDRLLGVLYRWANHISGSRIGFAGFVSVYPLYGPDLSNHVQPVGFLHRHGQLVFASSCRDWRRALNDGRYNYVAIVPGLQ